MRLITVAGPPSSGKTSVLIKTLEAVAAEGVKPGVIKFDCLYTDDDALYQRWRDAKLKDYPAGLGDLVVEIDDPRKLSQREHDALLARCRKANMALYAGKTGADPDPEIPLSLGRRFGLQDINKNWLADETGLTSLTVQIGRAHV